MACVCVTRALVSRVHYQKPPHSIFSNATNIIFVDLFSQAQFSNHLTYYVPSVTQIDFLSYVTKKDSSTTFSAITKFCLEIFVHQHCGQLTKNFDCKVVIENMPSCKSWQNPVLQREDWDEDKSIVKRTETEEEDNHYDFTDAKKELRLGLVCSILTSHDDDHLYIMINIDHDFVDAEKESRWGVVYSILTSHNDNHLYNDYHGSLFCWCWERRRR